MDIESPDPAAVPANGASNGHSEKSHKVSDVQVPPTARSFINLDSPSPEPEPESRPKKRKQKLGGEEPAETGLSAQPNGAASSATPSKRTASRQAHDDQVEVEDSRYSVTKGKNPSAQRQQEPQYIALDDSDSDSDSDVEIISSPVGEGESDDDDVHVVSGGKAGSKNGTGKSNRAEGKSKSNGSDADGRPRTRSRTLSQSQTQSKDDTSVPPASGRRNSSTSRSGARDGPTPPTAISAKQKRDYWSGKGKVDREALDKVEEDAYKYGSDSSDSDDAVTVTSSTAIAAKKKAQKE